MLNTTKGPARERLEPNVVNRLQTAGTLVHDERRLRSFFFDGRFLTAKDLTREQAYFLTRQADLSRGGGVGVVTGLRVDDVDPRALRINAGHGVTPSGEAVVIPRDLTNVRLDDIPEIQRLDAAFGLSPIPRETARNRSGLYIVALRPVEYTANLVASYPSSVGGTRTVQDGDIIEATAITLIPFPDSQAGANFASRRSRVAHEIFVRNGGMRSPVDALPLAMVALDHGVIRWVDEFLVRREVGSEQTDFLGFGQAPRALREAHLLQYQQHLREVLTDRNKSGQGERFAASEHFFALPPAGPLPASAVDPQNFTEVFFPPEVDVELSVVPEDELGALLQESLFLSPIDLTRTGEELASTSVLVMVPVARDKMDEVLALLFPAERAGTVELRATAAGLVSKRQPGEALKALTFRRTALTATSSSSEPSLVDAAWSNVLSGATTLWYARRRSFPYKPAALGQQVVEPDDAENNFTRALVQVELYDEFGSLPTRATSLAIGKTYDLLLTYTLPDPNPPPTTPGSPFPPTQAPTTGTDEYAGKHHYRFLFTELGGQILRQKWLDSAAVAEIEKLKADANLGKGLLILSDKLASDPLRESFLRACARARSAVALDKKIYSVRDDATALGAIVTAVTEQLNTGGSLDDAATKLSIPF
ncbi:hypothetical protein ACN28E_21160 [Archangium lansingense]|uniref:hypothetical protein n=1 Tax=Archangium lansingense TaxID=2995310 RepID=UPI003B7AE567